MIETIKKILSLSKIPSFVRRNIKKKGSFVALFHGVHKKMYGIHPNAQRDLTIEQFDRMLFWIGKHFEFITPEQYFNGYRGGVLLTFDDGLHNNYANAIHILEKHNAPAIFFIPTQHIQNPRDWLWFIKDRARSEWEVLPNDVPEHIAIDLYDGMNENQLKELAKHPLATIGAHTITHPKLTECSSEQIISELKDAKTYLQKLTQQPIETFAYPQGLYNLEILNMVKQYYKYGFAVDPEKIGDVNYEIARVSLHRDSSYYMDLKFSGLHKTPTKIEY